MSNNYQRLRVLTARAIRTVATVTAHNPDGTSAVELMSGTSITVLGQDVAIGSKAYIEDGRIIGAAADLPYADIDV